MIHLRLGAGKPALVLSAVYAMGMKTCTGCGYIYADDYAGTCTECGRGMGGIQGNTTGDLSFRYARQLNDMTRTNGQETSMQRGNYDRVDVPKGLLDAARGFVTVDEKKLREAQDA